MLQQLLGFSNDSDSKNNNKRDISEEQALKKIHGSIIMNEKKIKNYNENIKQCALNAAKYVRSGNTVAAKRELVKKKQLEQQINVLNSTTTTLTQQMFMIENQSTTKVTLDSLKYGTNVMRNFTAEINPEDVSDTMTDIESYMTEANEINEALAEGIMINPDDNDVLEDELKLLIQNNLPEIDTDTRENVTQKIKHIVDEKNTSEIKVKKNDVLSELSQMYA